MRFSLFLLAFACLPGCDDTGPVRPDSGGVDGTFDGGPPGDAGNRGGCSPLSITPIAAGMVAPVLVTAPAGDDRLFVVNLTGTVALIQADGETSTFLDLGASITLTSDRGLNGLAFHPDFGTNGRFYVTYAPSRSTLRLSSFELLDANTADPSTEVLLLETTFPETTHTGGHLAFGPDGYLYVGVGDGEMSPTMMLAQDTTSLLGSILRIDVDSASPYAIPSDNPFVGAGGGVREEIFAFGFRLPYRFSFSGTDLLVGEVGDTRFEQVELVTSGGNYGWPIVEGNMHCHTPRTGCDTSTSEPPLFEFEHSGGRCAMMGGFVYRGDDLPSCHQGRYFFADFCTGAVTSFTIEGRAATDVQAGPVAPSMVVSWGRGGDGELYLLGMDGEVFKLTAAP